MRKPFSSYGSTSLIISAVMIKVLYCYVLLHFFDINFADDFYDEIAHNLLQGKGFSINGTEPVTWRAPLYPLVLLFIYKFFSDSIIIVSLFQFLFDIGTAFLGYCLARQIYNSYVALYSFLLILIYPFFSYYTVTILSESLFCLLFIVSLYLYYLSYIEKSYIYSFTTGIFLGLAILCKFSLMLFPFILIIFLFIKNILKSAVIHSFCIIIGTFIILMPWIARNKSVTDHFVLGTGGGYNLWLGNHIPTKGLDHDELAAKEVIKLDNTINKIAINQDPFSVESSKQFTKEAIQEAYLHPLKTLFLIGKKSLRFWFHIYHPTHKKYGYLLIPIECGLIFFSIIGIYFSFKHGLHISPFLISILYFNIIHAILISTFRYSIPIHPIIIILFSYVILITKQKFTN